MTKRITKKQILKMIKAATEEVASWPKWKQNILEQSASPTVSVPRKLVINK